MQVQRKYKMIKLPTADEGLTLFTCPILSSQHDSKTPAWQRQTDRQTEKAVAWDATKGRERKKDKHSRRSAEHKQYNFPLLSLSFPGKSVPEPHLALLYFMKLIILVNCLAKTMPIYAGCR